MHSFNAPFVMRASRHQESNQFIDEGFHVCYNGVAILCTETKRLTIVESEQFDEMGFGSPPLLVLSLDSVVEFEFRKFASRSRNYRGGRVRLVGVFDRDHQERLTLKLPLDEYHVFIQTLKLLLE